MTVRPPAVAGSFYEGTAARLEAVVGEMLDQAETPPLELVPRIAIVPHAGHIYSGPVAATAYRMMKTIPDVRFGLIGPSHFVRFRGIAGPIHESFASPLGEIPVDPLVADLVSSELVIRLWEAHEREHSLEVQLPFLQVLKQGPTIVPLLTGDDDPSAAVAVIERLLDHGCFVVVSSDLSHYLDYETARSADRRTSDAIVHLRDADLGPNSACGRTAVRGALRVAAARGWRCRLLDLRNSGDTAGPRDRVVGYGSFAIGPPR